MVFQNYLQMEQFKEMQWNILVQHKLSQKETAYRVMAITLEIENELVTFQLWIGNNALTTFSFCKKLLSMQRFFYCKQVEIVNYRGIEFFWYILNKY